MKAVINCARPKTQWQREFFGDMNPYMLPVLGKPLIEFYIDWCALSSVSEILISCEDFDEELNRFLDGGSKWGVSIAVVTSPPRRSWKEEIILHNASFLGESGFVYIDRFFFPMYDKNAKKVDSTSLDIGKIQLCPPSSEKIFCPCDCVELNTLRDYYDLNMSLLRSKTSTLIMRGYSAQEGVFMGMNDVIMRRAELVPPFIVGDNVQIEEDAQIGPNTIIGDTCIIDRQTYMEDSVVFDRTYIGSDLNLCKKILYGRKLIDPIDGVQVTFSDNFFTSKVSSYSTVKFIDYCFEAFFALIFETILAFPYMLFFAIGHKCRKKISVPTKSGQVVLPRCERTDNIKDIWFLKFSLDKFAPLRKVIKGQFRLIGDTPRDAQKDAEIIARYKKYTPGVFTYADSLGHDDDYETLIDDLFYKHNRTLKTDMQLILRSFVSRLLMGVKRDDEI